MNVTNGRNSSQPLTSKVYNHVNLTGNFFYFDEPEILNYSD